MQKKEKRIPKNERFDLCLSLIGWDEYLNKQLPEFNLDGTPNCDNTVLKLMIIQKERQMREESYSIGYRDAVYEASKRFDKSN